MAVITDISPQKGNKSRVNVFTDGEFFCGMDALTAARNRLRVGEQVDPEQLKRAVLESEANSAFERAVGYLGAAARSTREMRTYLQKKGYSPESVESAVNKLTEYGYLDDVRYCRDFIRVYSAKYGEAVLRAKLSLKGISRDITDECLSDCGDNTDAILALCRKYLSCHSCDWRKLTAYLLRKGYNYDEVKSCVRQIAADCDGE